MDTPAPLNPDVGIPVFEDLGPVHGIIIQASYAGPPTALSIKTHDSICAAGRSAGIEKFSAFCNYATRVGYIGFLTTMPERVDLFRKLCSDMKDVQIVVKYSTCDPDARFGS